MQGIMEFAAYVVEVLLATPDFGSICGLHGDWRMALQAGVKESFVFPPSLSLPFSQDVFRLAETQIHTHKYKFVLP